MKRHTTDDHMIAAMRLLLASLALLIVSIDPAEPVYHVRATYMVLVGYFVYSTALYGLTWREKPFSVVTSAHWLDVVWYVVLCGASGGSQSIFFPFFFFAILTAAFRWGFATGLWATLASVFLYTVVGFISTPVVPGLNLNHFLLRSTSLLGLGYMITYGGGSENAMKQRLILLKDVSTLSNPRFGVERTLNAILQRLRTFYAAEVSLIVMADPVTGAQQIFHPETQDGDLRKPEQPRYSALIALLLTLPEEQALLSRRGLGKWWHSATRPNVCAYDIDSGARLAGGVRVSAELAAVPFITVPIAYRGVTVGRLYIAATRPSAFTPADVAFLLQVIEHVMPSLDNIRLVDRLASDAAEAERHRIARDLHDSIIQPYIGLQMGLTALQQKLKAGRLDLHKDIERLLELTVLGISDLRRYVHGLKDGSDSEGGLLPAVQRYAHKFAEATGMTVDVDAAPQMSINDRLAAEVFQMIVEGLSNVRRHSTSTWARLHLACHDDTLTLCIENASRANTSLPLFTPRSLSERAAALGGAVDITSSVVGTTIVRITIPL